jgi:SAM-dependent methyltransferase
MSFDANAHRDASLQGWEEAAAGWVRSQELLREFGAPVSHWLIDAVAPQPGQRVLELAAGLGETGLLAAELVAPVGGAVISDQAEAMLSGARERAAALGLSNVEFQVLNAEWIDLPVASVDVVLCRWGYMLMADPAAALGETRRVLRPSGRVALAVWDAIEHNPWALLPGAELRERGLTPPPVPGAPGSNAHGLCSIASHTASATRPLGRVALAVWDAIEHNPWALLPGAELRVQTLQLHRRHASFEEFWETTLDLSRPFHDAVLARPQSEIEEIRAAVRKRLEPYEAAGGVLDIPGRTLVASASA